MTGATARDNRPRQLQVYHVGINRAKEAARSLLKESFENRIDSR